MQKINYCDECGLEMDYITQTDDYVLFACRNGDCKNLNKAIERKKGNKLINIINMNHEFNYQNKKDEYYTKEYAILPIIKYLKAGSTVWCPFDTCESNYVKMLEKNGFSVVYGHIWDGKDFFEYEPQHYDYVISNPPYSLRQPILERLYLLKKPFAMLINVSGLFDSKKRFELFKNNPFELMVFNKRINYINTDNKKSPPFASIYICSEILPNKIVFEEINK